MQRHRSLAAAFVGKICELLKDESVMNGCIHFPVSVYERCRLSANLSRFRYLQTAIILTSAAFSTSLLSLLSSFAIVPVIVT